MNSLHHSNASDPFTNSTHVITNINKNHGLHINSTQIDHFIDHSSQ